MADEMDVQIDELGSSWTWNSLTLMGVQGTRRRLLSLDGSGFSPEETFILVFRKEDLGSSLPESGQTVTDNTSGASFRIESVETSQGDPGVTLNCISLNE